MRLAITYLSNNGTVEAFVIGHPQWRATGKSKNEAEDRLQTQLIEKLRTGELRFLEIAEPYSFAERARQMTDEDREAWREMTEELYRERDAEKAAEFPE